MKKQASSFSLSPENIAYIDDQWSSKGKRNRSHWLDDLITHLREKSAKPESKNLPAQAMQYPPELNIEAWNEWKAYRKEVKLKAYKPTPRSEGAAVKNLIKLSKGDYNTQTLIVQQSIANGYQGLFEVNNNETRKQPTNAIGISAAQAAIAAARQERDSAQSGSPLGFNDRALHGQVDKEKWSGRVIDMDGGDI